MMGGYKEQVKYGDVFWVDLSDECTGTYDLSLIHI